MTELMAPGKPHQLLLEMVGMWSATVTSHMGGSPDTSQGSAEYESVLGGRYVLGRFKGTMGSQPFEGLSVDGYDNAKEQYFSIWMDSMGTGYFVSHGTASTDGKTVSYSGKMTMGPREITSRSETAKVDRDTMTFTMWNTMDGRESKVLEITYKRKK